VTDRQASGGLALLACGLFIIGLVYLILVLAFGRKGRPGGT
jgi:hypothetical protein